MCPKVAIDNEQTPPLRTPLTTTTSQQDPKSSLIFGEVETGPSPQSPLIVASSTSALQP